MCHNDKVTTDPWDSYHFLQLPNYFSLVSFLDTWKAAIPFLFPWDLKTDIPISAFLAFLFWPTVKNRWDFFLFYSYILFMSNWKVRKGDSSLIGRCQEDCLIVIGSYRRGLTTPWSLSIWRPRGTKWWQCRLLVWSSRLTAFERLLRPQKRSAAQEEDASSLLGNDVRRWPCFFFFFVDVVVVVVSSGRLNSTSSYLPHWRWCGENVCTCEALDFQRTAVSFIPKSGENSISLDFRNLGYLNGIICILCQNWKSLPM